MGTTFYVTVLRTTMSRSNAEPPIFFASKVLRSPQGFQDVQEISFTSGLAKYHSFELNTTFQTYNLIYTVSYSIFDVLKCFQLAGVAAIAIASKKEESDPPRLDELARFTAGSCQVQDIKDQELQMLKVINSTGVVSMW